MRNKTDITEKRTEPNNRCTHKLDSETFNYTRGNNCIKCTCEHCSLYILYTYEERCNQPNELKRKRYQHVHTHTHAHHSEQKK